MRYNDNLKHRAVYFQSGLADYAKQVVSMPQSLIGHRPKPATADYMSSSGDGCELVKDCGRRLSMDQRFQGERTDGVIKATAELWRIRSMNRVQMECDTPSVIEQASQECLHSFRLTRSSGRYRCTNFQSPLRV